MLEFGAVALAGEAEVDPGGEVGGGVNAVELGRDGGPAQDRLGRGGQGDVADGEAGARVARIGAGDGFVEVVQAVAIGVGGGGQAAAVARGPDVGDPVAVGVDHGEGGQRKHTGGQGGGEEETGGHAGSVGRVSGRIRWSPA